MATGDGAEVSVGLSPVGDAGAGRQGAAGPAQSGRESTLWIDVVNWMVGCCVWGPADRREAPIGLCRWAYVVDF